MDPANYYITTITNAVMKIGPYVLFIVGGYFVFIKMPFLFLKKSMDHQKKKLAEAKKDEQPLQTKLKISGPKTEQRKVDSKTTEKKSERKREEVKRPAKPTVTSPEEVLGFKAGQTFTQSELKKRYYELLKQNHPDHVATMGQDFKTLAEKNTKELNRAYDTLKKKAA
jgi:hypothetical protein